MAGAYASYFDNPFLALRMGRPAYKAQARYTLKAVGDADLGKAFEPLLAELAAAIAGFDENLLERGQPTAGATGAYHQARTAWLEFVDDTMKDYVTPKLRKLPVYADFKKFGKSRLTDLKQPELLTVSADLVQLYAAQQGALARPTLAAEARAALKAVADADETRDGQAAATDDAILALADDRAAIARAQRRLKAQLELAFDLPAKVDSYFDFAQAEQARKADKKAAKAKTKADAQAQPAADAPGAPLA